MLRLVVVVVVDISDSLFQSSEYLAHSLSSCSGHQHASIAIVHSRPSLVYKYKRYVVFEGNLREFVGRLNHQRGSHLIQIKKKMNERRVDGEGDGDGDGDIE